MMSKFSRMCIIAIVGTVALVAMSGAATADTQTTKTIEWQVENPEAVTSNVPDEPVKGGGTCADSTGMAGTHEGYCLTGSPEDSDRTDDNTEQQDKKGDGIDFSHKGSDELREGETGVSFDITGCPTGVVDQNAPSNPAEMAEGELKDAVVDYAIENGGKFAKLAGKSVSVAGHAGTLADCIGGGYDPDLD
jgi:hypothetical protein